MTDRNGANWQGDKASTGLGMVVERDEPGHAAVSMVVREDMTRDPMVLG